MQPYTHTQHFHTNCANYFDGVCEREDRYGARYGGANYGAAALFGGVIGLIFPLFGSALEKYPGISRGVLSKNEKIRIGVSSPTSSLIIMAFLVIAERFV